MPYDEPKSCVFWDMVDFPTLPYGVDPHPACLRARRILQLLGKRRSDDFFSVKAYVDKDTYPVVSYDDATGTAVHPVHGGKYARADTMLVDIVLWALENPATYFKPVDLMVISQNVIEGSDFLHALEALQDRYYNVVLVVVGERPISTRISVDAELWPFLMNYLQFSHEDRRYAFPEPLHKPKNVEETGPFPSRVASLQPKIIARTDVVIFMDATGCPADKECDLPLFIDSALTGKDYYGDATVLAYLEEGEKMYLSKIIQMISFVTKGQNEYAKFTRMVMGMLFWAMNNEEPAHFMLISKRATYMSQSQWDSIVRALESRGSDVVFPPSNDIELPLSRHTFDLICKGPPVEVVTPFRLEEPVDPKLQRFKSDSIAIFWVVNEFPSDPMIVNYIYSSMEATMERKGYDGSVVSLMAYVNDIELTKIRKRPELSISYLPEGNKYEKVTRILVDMFLFAMKNGKGSSLIVVSEPFKDAMFDKFCEFLRGRDFNVFQTHLDYMVTSGTAAWSSRTGLASYCQCEVCLATALRTLMRRLGC